MKKAGEIAAIIVAALAATTAITASFSWLYGIKIDVAVLKHDVAEIHDILFPRHAETEPHAPPTYKR